MNNKDMSTINDKVTTNTAFDVLMYIFYILISQQDAMT